MTTCVVDRPDELAGPEPRGGPMLAIASSGASAAHANAYLRKPIGFDELVEVLSVLDAFWFDCTVPWR